MYVLSKCWENSPITNASDCTTISKSKINFFELFYYLPWSLSGLLHLYKKKHWFSLQLQKFVLIWIKKLLFGSPNFNISIKNIMDKSSRFRRVSSIKTKKNGEIVIEHFMDDGSERDQLSVFEWRKYVDNSLESSIVDEKNTTATWNCCSRVKK